LFRDIWSLQRAGVIQRADVIVAENFPSGSGFVRAYHEAQVSELESAIALLKRYLEKPDNDSVREYATAQLPSLKRSLEDSRSLLQRAP
jgi:hypothetical protein